MARTINQIKDEIIAAKEATPGLASLTSNSAVAIWRLWVYVVATAIYMAELIFDQFRAEVDANVAARRPGTPAWYVEVVKAFQYPGTPQVIDGIYTYPVIDPTKQIVTRVSYKEVDDDGYTFLQFKVAKGDIGEEQPLTNDEKAKLVAYVNNAKFAGQKTLITSLAADKLRVTAEIFFDGIYSQEDVQTNVEAALNNYLRNLDFNGLIYISRLQDAIQSVTGVIDVVIEEASIVTGVTATEIERVAELPAGYAVEDASSGNTFGDLITYTPQQSI